MAEFNKGADFIGPQGVGGISVPTNRTAEALFKGIGNTLDTALVGFDRAAREDIRLTAEKEAGAVRNQVLNQNLPTGVTTGTQNIQQLQTALNQNRITETEYDVKLLNIVKGLKQSYPGYRDVVDQNIQRITGRNPANSLIRATFAAQREALKDQRAKRTRYDSLINQASKDGHLHPDFRNRSQEFNENYIYGRRLKDAEFKREQKRIELLKKQGEQTDRENFKLGSKVAQDVVDRAYLDAFPDTPNASFEAIKKIIKDFSADNEIDENEKKQLRDLFVQLMTSVNHNLDKKLGELDLDAVQKQKIKNNELKRLNTLERAITSKDVGVLTLNAAIIESREAGRAADVDRIRRQYKVVDALDLAKRVGAQAGVQQALNVPGVTGAFNTVIHGIVSGSIVAGDGDPVPIDQAIRDVTNFGASPRTTGAMIQNLHSTAVSPKTNPQARSRIARSIYGNPDAYRDLPEEDQFKAFKFLASPATTQSMLELKKTSPKEWNAYVNFTTRNSERALRFKLKPIKDLLTNGFHGLKPHYDEATNTLSFKVKGEPSMARQADLRLTMSRLGAKEAMENVNTVLGSLKALADATDQNYSEIVKALFSVNGINIAPEEPKKEGDKEPKETTITPTEYDVAPVGRTFWRRNEETGELELRDEEGTVVHTRKESPPVDTFDAELADVTDDVSPEEGITQAPEFPPLPDVPEVAPLQPGEIGTHDADLADITDPDLEPPTEPVQGPQDVSGGKVPDTTQKAVRKAPSAPKKDFVTSALGVADPSKGFEGFDKPTPVAKKAGVKITPTTAVKSVKNVDRTIRASGDFTTKAPAVVSQLQKDLGLTKIQAAGIVGNLGHESNGFATLQEVKPLVPGSRGGFGWAQWTGPRRRAFEKWAKANKLDINSPAANYGFLLHELTQTREGNVLAKLKKAKTVEEATSIFSKVFLRPGIVHMNSRIAWAKRAL